MRIKVTPGGCVPPGRMLANIFSARKRNLPRAEGAGSLALVGGGPSAAEHVDTLRQWPGEVWAINGAAGWCHRNGIDAAFLTVHPTMQYVPDCIRRVVLGTECAPEMFDALAGRDVRVLPDVEINGEMHRGGTTATATAFALPYMGFSDITFFGLEGSYGETQSHSYPTARDPNEVWIVVMAGPRLYRTKLEFLHQSVVLAELVNAFPQYEERSGGLLRALVADHEYDVTDMLPALREEIERATAH